LPVAYFLGMILPFGSLSVLIFGVGGENFPGIFSSLGTKPFPRLLFLFDRFFSFFYFTFRGWRFSVKKDLSPLSVEPLPSSEHSFAISHSGVSFLVRERFDSSGRHGGQSLTPVSVSVSDPLFCSTEFSQLSLRYVGLSPLRRRAGALDFLKSRPVCPLLETAVFLRFSFTFPGPPRSPCWSSFAPVARQSLPEVPLSVPFFWIQDVFYD